MSTKPEGFLNAVAIKLLVGLRRSLFSSNPELQDKKTVGLTLLNITLKLVISIEVM